MMKIHGFLAGDCLFSGNFHSSIGPAFSAMSAFLSVKTYIPLKIFPEGISSETTALIQAGVISPSPFTSRTRFNWTLLRLRLELWGHRRWQKKRKGSFTAGSRVRVPKGGEIQPK